MNPPPLERLHPFWGWWGKPAYALRVFYSARFGQGEMPESVLEIGAQLMLKRNYHPADAVWMVMEGMDRVAMRTTPKDWIACRTFQDWLKVFPDRAPGSYRR